MTARSTAQMIVVLRRVEQPAEIDRRQPKLSMSWSVDPATGKLVACWMAEGTELDRTLSLRPAA